MDILRSPYQEEIPKVYKYQTFKGTEILVGPYAKVIESFATYMNYTLELVEENNIKMSDIQKKMELNFYNISLHTATYESCFAQINFSYPLEFSDTCVMVPAKDELPRYWYIVWPFGRYIWSFMFISVFYVAYVMTYLKHPTHSYGSNLLYSMSLVMYCSNASFRFNNIPLRLQLFYTLVIIMGFIMSSYYCSFLTMYNMRPVFQSYIKTIDDALEANIQILISSNILEDLRNNIYVNLTLISKLLKETAPSNISEKIKQKNRSFAYVVTQTQWIFMSQLQEHLIQPIYQLSDICFGKVFSTYPIQFNAKFLNSLDMFILYIAQSGLWKLWEEEAFILALSNESFELLEDEYPIDPLNLYYFRVAWIILAIGINIFGIGGGRGGGRGFGYGGGRGYGFIGGGGFVPFPYRRSPFYGPFYGF
ncbi:uncharacterized protein LOC111689036 [Lucilia cuprina]|uniref:uncharacterized protein LOC111689036 n=1 Tax=Lucilia cuprina TaxID=7375 RepID=UPI001F070CC2|nr:uncharacterized protein LOC111689036 [Lucilia cuprina]